LYLSWNVLSSLSLSAFISPFRSDRKIASSLVKYGEFIEIFVDTPLDVCETRDPKGLYKKARNGDIKNFTGISSPYEKPEAPIIHLKTDRLDLDQCVDKIIDYLRKYEYIKESK